MLLKSWRLLGFLAIGTVAFAAQSNNDVIETGNTLFLQKCAFCHGRDAGGGETGPDLTRSDLVKADVNGDKIGLVIRNGRPEKGMPNWTGVFSDEQFAQILSFLHTVQTR